MVGENRMVRGWIWRFAHIQSSFLGSWQADESMLVERPASGSPNSYVAGRKIWAVNSMREGA